MPILPLVVSRFKRLVAKVSAEVLFASETLAGFVMVRVVPFIVKLPPTVVSPVPVVKLVAPVWVKLPASVVLFAREINPEPEFKTILPVDVPPRVRV